MAVKTMTLLQDAVLRQKAWSMPFDAVDPTGANDHFLHIRNDGARSLAVLELEISSTVAGNVEPFRATGDASNSPSAIDVANLSGPGGPDPVGTFETGVNLALTEGEFLGRYYLAADTPREPTIFIVIPPGTRLGFNWEASTGILSGRAQVIELAPDEDPVK